MKKAHFLLVLLMVSLSIFAQDRFEDKTNNNVSSQTSSGSQTNITNNQVYCNNLEYSRAAYDGDAVNEARLNTRNNKAYITTNNGQIVNASNGSMGITPFSMAYDALVRKASQAFLDKKYSKCIEFCDEMLVITRDSPDAYFFKGACNYALDKKEIGIQFFKIAASKGSKDAEYVLKQVKQ